MNCYRFLASHKYGIRIGTHVLQRMPSEVYDDEAKKYVAGLQTNGMQDPCRDPRFVLNMDMDQTPVFFTMTPITTLGRKGKKTINIQRSTNTTSRISFALTVTASEELLRRLENHIDALTEKS
jgi:hypothetical protein